MASGPITSWQIGGETVTDLCFGLQNHSWLWLHREIKRCLLLGRKVMNNWDSILKWRNIIIQAKFWPVKAMLFPGVIYGYESWTIKKAECQSDERWKIDGWLASPSPWMWIWVNSGSWWWAGRPGVLPSIDSQRVGHNWTELMIFPVAMDRCDSWIIKKAES